MPKQDDIAYTMTVQTGPIVLNGGKPFTVTSVKLVGDTQASGVAPEDYADFKLLGMFDMTRKKKTE